MFEHWLQIVEFYFIGHTAIKAVVAGLVTSWCATQGWKFHPAIAAKPDYKARRITRALAFVFGFGPTLVLWPNPGIERWPIAVMVGLAAPFAYTLVSRVAYHFWPWLEGHVSARPSR